MTLTIHGTQSKQSALAALDALFVPTVGEKRARGKQGVAKGSFTVQMTNEEYHADRTAVSCSRLKELLRSPAHFHVAQNADPKPSTTPQALGTAMHTMVLEPSQFQRTVAVWDGKTTRNSNAYKEFAKANSGKLILNEREHASVVGMCNAVISYNMPDGFDLGQLLASGESEKSIYFVDEETGILCKVRLDNLYNNQSIFDLKSCDDCRPDEFITTQALKLHYDLQTAMYMRAVHALLGIWLPFVFVAVEIDAPHAVWLHEADISSEFVQNGMRKFRYVMNKLKECRQSDAWPAYGNAYTRLDAIPAYARFES